MTSTRCWEGERESGVGECEHVRFPDPLRAALFPVPHAPEKVERIALQTHLETRETTRLTPRAGTRFHSPVAHPRVAHLQEGANGGCVVIAHKRKARQSGFAKLRTDCAHEFATPGMRFGLRLSETNSDRSSSSFFKSTLTSFGILIGSEPPLAHWVTLEEVGGLEGCTQRPLIERSRVRPSPAASTLSSW
jgi:hypothetical protein